MKFHPPLKEAILLRRYKRFLADVLIDGKEMTVHCANTGSMTNCVVSQSRCWLSKSQNKARKYAYSLELVTSATGHIACVNTARANTLVAEALEARDLPELAGYEDIRREVAIGERSRADFLLSPGPSADAAKAPGRCFLEVKSVTYGLEDGLGIFPDTKSERASRHLDELMAAADAGDRAVLLFCVLHEGVSRVAPAAVIDPVYANKLRQAADRGVVLLAYGCSLSANEMRVTRALEIQLYAISQ